MEQEIMYRTISESLVEMILVFDNSGKILYGNRAAKEELAYEENLCGINMTDIFKQEYQETEAGTFSLEELPIQGETVIYRKNNSCFPVSIRRIELEKEHYLLSALNITDKKEMEKMLWKIKDEAEGALKVRNEFVANVTHELRTPVNGIKGHVMTMMESAHTPEQGKTLEIICHCCTNMTEIINNILDFSKLESGKFTMEEKEFNFYELIDHVVATNIVAIEKKGLRISVNVDRNIPKYLCGDELRLTQILNNLLSNAVKFTDIGFISVEVTRTMQFNDEIELFFMVRDTGIGISPKEKDRLFQSFSQGDASITRKYGGTGLGLAITKELVELMNGSIHVESEKGKGSIFTFSVRFHIPDMDLVQQEVKQAFQFLNKTEDMTGIETLLQYGTEKNLEEIRKKMENLIICIELGAWEKAEAFADNVKKLVENGSPELKKLVFRIELAVRKEDYEKSMQWYERLKEELMKSYGGKMKYGAGDEYKRNS